MRSSDPRLGRVVVDGAELLIPDASAWSELRRENDLDGRPLASGAILERHLTLGDRVPDLVVALGDEGAPGKPWVVVHLVRLGHELVRVLVEGQTCFACGASLLGGNARDYQIHVGTPDPLAAVRKALARPSVTCPRCGEPLSRPAVIAFDVGAR